MLEMFLYEGISILSYFTSFRESDQNSDIKEVGNRSEILTAEMCLVLLNNLESKK